ncbi:MAG TPA: AI-2E family transporter, partial [Gemmataceae bacterium]|nr:AI-2E family transporter [Gemmataceae bacterium]
MAAPTSSAPTVQRTFFVLATLMLVIAALYFGRPVLLPLTLAVLFSFILTPAVSWLERHRLPRTPAVLIVALVLFALLGGLGYFITKQVGQLADELRSEKYQPNIQSRIDTLPEAVAAPVRNFLRMNSAVKQNIQKAKDAAEEAGVKSPEPAPAPRPANPAGPDLHWLTDLLPTAAEGLANTLLVIVLAIFMLVKREDLRDRMIRLFGHGHLTATTKAIDEAGQRTSRYLFMLFLVNLSTGLILSLGFKLLGVPYPLLWGLLIGTLRFIPYIGVWVGALAPLALSVATSPPGDWYHPLGVLGLIL